MRLCGEFQYPLHHIVEADLRNLKTLVRTLLAMISEIDFDPIWSELNDPVDGRHTKRVHDQ